MQGVNKSDVIVLCSSDHSPMTAHFSDADALVCVAAGCRMSWSREEGYKRDVKDAAAEKEQMRCGNAQHGFLYIAEADPEQTIWRCIVDGCHESVIKRNPFSADQRERSTGHTLLRLADVQGEKEKLASLFRRSRRPAKDY